jgi:phenylalanyl-tRNA synthetase beta chain
VYLRNCDCEFSDDLLSEALTVYSPRGYKLAVFGMVHPKIRKMLDIDQEVFFADLNWNALMTEIAKHKVQYSEISKYPEVKRDFALLIDKQVTFAEIEKIAFDTERKFAEKGNAFRDVYEGKNLPEGKKYVCGEFCSSG